MEVELINTVTGIHLKENTDFLDIEFDVEEIYSQESNIEILNSIDLNKIIDMSDSDFKQAISFLNKLREVWRTL